MAGAAKELGLHSQTVQGVVEEYARRRKQFQKLLRWRGKKSLGWIPFKAAGVKVTFANVREWNAAGSCKSRARGRGFVSYCGKRYEFWASRVPSVGCSPQDRVVQPECAGALVSQPDVRDDRARLRLRRGRGGRRSRYQGDGHSIHRHETGGAVPQGSLFASRSAAWSSRGLRLGVARRGVASLACFQRRSAWPSCTPGWLMPERTICTRPPPSWSKSIGRSFWEMFRASS